MRLTSLMICTVAALMLTACGGFASGGSSSLNSLSTPTPTPTPTPAPTLNASQLGATESALATLVSQLLVKLQNINNVSLAIANQSLTANTSVACPSGGTMAVVGAGQLSLSVSSYIYGTLSQVGPASITFTNCAISSSIAVNGTVAASNLSGAFELQYSTPTNGGYLVQGSDQLIGNLQVTSGSVSQTCALSVTNTVSFSGSLNFFSNGTMFSSSNTGEAAFEGSFCNEDVEQQVSLAF